MPAVTCPSPLLADIFSSRAVTAELRNFQGSLCLSEKDWVHVRNASLKRRDEFAAGRICAAAALKLLGSHSVQVGRQVTGAPIWPAGVVGSISHTDNVAVAAVAYSDQLQAIGLDIERIGAVEPALWSMLFTQTEHLRLEDVDLQARDWLATALFAAKEAFYKAQWPITREWLDFLDVEIELRGHTFVVLPRNRKTWTRCLREPPCGFLAIHGDVVAAAVLIPA